MVFQVLAWLGIALLVFAILVLVLPVHVAVLWQSDPAKPSTVALRLLGGVILAIKVYDSSRPAKPKKKAAHKDRRRRRARGSGRLPQRNVLTEVPPLIHRLLAAVHVDQLRLDAEFGLGDPAETGQLYGQLCPLIYTSAGRISLRPNFDVPCLKGTGLARLHFSVLGLVWPFFRFGWRMIVPVR